MKKPTYRPRSPFLVWWNQVAPLYEDSSRYELARLAWQEAKRQTRARRAARAARNSGAQHGQQEGT